MWRSVSSTPLLHATSSDARSRKYPCAARILPKSLSNHKKLDAAESAGGHFPEGPACFTARQRRGAGTKEGFGLDQGGPGRLSCPVRRNFPDRDPARDGLQIRELGVSRQSGIDVSSNAVSRDHDRHQSRIAGKNQPTDFRATAASLEKRADSDVT